jgi:predicted DNA-binding transcriptional regulator AlpA
MPGPVAGLFLLFIPLTWRKRILMKKLDLTDDEIALILSRRQETAALEARIQQRFDQLERKLDEVLAAMKETAVKKDEYLSIDQVCEMLGISRKQLWRMRKADKIVKPAIENPLRWRRSDLENPT